MGRQQGDAVGIDEDGDVRSQNGAQAVQCGVVGAEAGAHDPRLHLPASATSDTATTSGYRSTTAVAAGPT